MDAFKVNINSLFVFAVSFTILIYLIPPNGLLNGDEEMYFKAASNNILNSFNFNSAFILNENTLNHRFLYDFICGRLVNYFGYELTHVYGRLFIVFLFSLSLTSLLEYFKASIVEVAFVLLSFLILHQNYYSGLQLFKGFLASDFSYSISLFSIVYMFKRKYLVALILLVLATYFHFLIGGYSFLFFIIYYYFNSDKKVFSLFYVFLYLILISPLLFILIKSNFSYDSSALDYDVNWIYSFVRHPHHLLPFKSYDEFIDNWLMGIVFSQILFFIVYYIHLKKLFIKHLNLSLFIIIGNIYLIFSFFISYFDSSLIFSKLYLFRPASLVFFLTLVFLTMFLVEKFKFYEILNSHNVKKGFIILFFGIFIYSFNTSSRFKSISVGVSEIKFLNFIKNNSNDNDVFLFKYSMLDFERKTGRLSFFSNKLVPTHHLGIIEWYNRRLFYQKIFSEGIFIENHNIDFFVTNMKTNNPNFGEILFENNKYVVYSCYSK